MAPFCVVGIVLGLAEEAEHEGRGLGGCDSPEAVSSLMTNSPGEGGDGVDSSSGCVVFSGCVCV